MRVLAAFAAAAVLICLFVQASSSFSLEERTQGPVVFVEDTLYSEPLTWENVTVDDVGAVTSVSVAALPVGSGIFLHYVRALITADEAERLIGVCDDRQGWSSSPIRLGAQTTVDGGSIESHGDRPRIRTSSSCPLIWPPHYRRLEADPDAFGDKGAALLGELGLAVAVSRRVARLMGVDDSAVEPLQLVRYRYGESYSTHHDHGAYYGWASEQRPYTLLLFLNSVPEGDGGGHTAFPTLKTKVLPHSGDAILWANTDFGATADAAAADPAVQAGAGQASVLPPAVLLDAVHEAVSIMLPGTVKYVANVWIGTSYEDIQASRARA